MITAQRCFLQRTDGQGPQIKCDLLCLGSGSFARFTTTKARSSSLVISHQRPRRTSTCDWLGSDARRKPHCTRTSAELHRIPNGFCWPFATRCGDQLGLDGTIFRWHFGQSAREESIVGGTSCAGGFANRDLFESVLPERDWGRTASPARPISDIGPTWHGARIEFACQWTPIQKRIGQHLSLLQWRPEQSQSRSPNHRRNVPCRRGWIANPA